MRKQSRISDLMGLPTGAPVAALLSAVLVGAGVFVSRMPGQAARLIGIVSSLAGCGCAVAGLAIARRRM